MTAAAREAIRHDRILADPKAAVDRRAFAFDLGGHPVVAYCWPGQRGAVRIQAEFCPPRRDGHKQSVPKVTGFAVLERRGGFRLTGDPETLRYLFKEVRVLAGLEVEPLAGLAVEVAAC